MCGLILIRPHCNFIPQFIPLQCEDANSNRYNYILTFSESKLVSVAGCAQICQTRPSPNLVGFEYSESIDLTDDDSNSEVACLCLYSGDDLPTPPSGSFTEVSTIYSGTGPIRGIGGDEIVDVFDPKCYAFPQVRKGARLASINVLSSYLISKMLLPGYCESYHHSCTHGHGISYRHFGLYRWTNHLPQWCHK